jgi:peptidoglycan hydrolase-like protein with peptidoglycan-binding domain
MKRITDSFIKKIVRQSLNESVGLLNEQYSYTLTKDWGPSGNTIPAGTTITNLTLPECPDGGFCYSNVSAAKSIQSKLSNKELIENGCGGKIKMGKPTLSTSKITDIATLLMNELNEIFIDYDTVKSQIQKLNDWPTFCAAYKISKRTPERSLGFIGTNTGKIEYGIENDDEGDKNDYYAFISTLYDNSIEITEEGVKPWKEDLIKNTNILLKKKIEDNKKLEQAKKEEEERKQKLGGGGSWIGFEAIQEHPALGKNEVIPTSQGDASVYSLKTGNPNIDKYLYGILVRKDNGTVEPVKFLTTEKTTPYTIDIENDQWIKWGFSKDNVWKYNDVIVSEDGKNIALTTNPDLENPFLQESFKKRGFRYNLLTEAEYKLGAKGDEVGKLQNKLGLPPDKGTPTFGPKTQAAVINFQKTEGAKLTPPLRTDGVVDDATFNAIMSITPPPLELSVAKKSKGEQVKTIQQKLGIKDDSSFGGDTETAVKEFQTKYSTKVTPPLRTDGVVDQPTYDLIMKLKGGDSRKIYTGGKTNYVKDDWIYVKPNKGLEGDLLADKKYFKVKSVSDDRYTVVLDIPIDATDYTLDTVGGVTAEILFGRDAEGESKTINISGDSNVDSGQEGSSTGKRNEVGSTEGSNNVDPEKEKRRKLRNQETCKTLREIKQYLNNTKGLSMDVNCKWNQEIRNQVMMALTGGNPAGQPNVETPGGTTSGGNNVTVY